MGHPGKSDCVVMPVVITGHRGCLGLSLLPCSLWLIYRVMMAMPIM